MTRFTLTVVDEDRFILTTEKAMTREEAEQTRHAFDAWRESAGALVIAECAVTPLVARQVALELDVEPDAASEADVRHERLLAEPFGAYQGVGRHVGSPAGLAAYPLDQVSSAIHHDVGCCATRGCHRVCSHLCGTDLHTCDGTTHPSCLCGDDHCVDCRERAVSAERAAYPIDWDPRRRGLGY